MGIQASTSTTTDCVKSYNLLVNGVTGFAKYTSSEFETNMKSASVTYQTALGYYPIYFKKF